MLETTLPVVGCSIFVLLVAVPRFLTALAFRYWFSGPRNGIVAGTALIAVSLALRLAT